MTHYALLLLLALPASAQVLVLVDTNKIPPGVKVEWRNDLYTVETHTIVTTNWFPVGPPINVVTNGMVVARRQHEAASLVTNVYHRLDYGGVERIFPVSQHFGPVLGTRAYDLPPPMVEHPVRLPPRLPRDSKL